MTKGEKIGSFIVGAVLFGGLFYVIYASVFGPQPDYGDLAGENYISDEFQTNDDDLTLEDEGTEAPAAATPAVPAEAPAPAAEKAPAGKR